jgi:hypothetical protein
MRRIQPLVSFAAAAMIACSVGVSSAAASFSYTFDSGNPFAEGWQTGNGNGNALSPATWLATSGVGGTGAIAAFDTFNGASSFFQSPAAPGGDNSANVGGTLSVDVRYMSSNQPWTHGFSIKLFGPGNGGNPYCVSTATSPTTTFTTFSFTMDHTAVLAGDQCQTPATDAQVAELLAGLQGMLIAGEDGANTGETTIIDNVTLSGGSPLVKHTLTVAKSGAGSGTVTSDLSAISCGATCSGQFFTSAVVALTETPAAGSMFTGWSGGCSGTTATCQVTISADTSVTATFSPTPPPAQNTLTVIDTGTGAGTVTSSPAGIDCGATCSASFTAGTSVTLTARAAAGSSFAGWSGACTGTGSCTLTMSAAQSVAATFNRVSRPPLSPPNTTIAHSTIDSSAGIASFKFGATGASTGFRCALVSKEAQARHVLELQVAEEVHAAEAGQVHVRGSRRRARRA